MKLYGTTTSPYVRRVRVVAAEVGEPVELIETASEAGQAALREVSPLRKVPVARFDGQVQFDSRAIIDRLIADHGPGGLVVARDRWRELDLINAIDAALDGVIQVFYLRRDGIAIDDTPFARRQLERADAIMAWLATQLAPDRRTFGDGFGLAELALISTLDWMAFRNTYPIERAAALAELRAAWAERPSLVATGPR